MMFHLDFETYSPADLKRVGAWRYALDTDAEVLCAAVSRGNGTPLLWLPPQYSILHEDPLEQLEAEDMMRDMEESDAPVYAHNAPFEYAVWNSIMTRYGFAPLSAARMRCTAVMARRACIPHSLAKCGAFLDLPQQKDTKGAALIRKFCLPQKPDKHHSSTWKRMPASDKENFRALCNYCVQDVRVEMQIREKLKLFDVGGWCQETFVNTLKVNEWGFPVDLEALHNTIAAVEGYLKPVEQRFQELTGFKHTQTKVLLPWLQERGYKGANLQAGTMDEELEEWQPDTEDGLTVEAREALALRRDLSFAAVKKLKAMLLSAGPHDNRVRDTLFFHGATTGRWSSQRVQQQNMKRPTIKESEAAFKMLRANVGHDTIELIFGPFFETVSNCIRHFINDGDSPLDSVDYSAVEARIVCWLAGEEGALREYVAGVDRYKLMAERIFKVSVDKITKDQRFVGKQTVLGCGFGMSAAKFMATCENLGQTVSVELAELAVSTFRAAHPNIVKFWYRLEGAARQAIHNPNSKFTAGKITCFSAAVAGKHFLFLKLPSGRMLSYPEPKVSEDGRITFFGQYPASQQWGRVDTYGGKLVENVTQAVAADCMAVGLNNAVRAGHQVVMIVHDEAVRLTRGSLLSREHMERCMTTLPSWADGLPIAVEGATMEVYTK